MWTESNSCFMCSVFILTFFMLDVAKSCNFFLTFCYETIMFGRVFLFFYFFFPLAYFPGTRAPAVGPIQVTSNSTLDMMPCYDT